MKFFFAALLLFASASTFAQEWKQMDHDDLFALARKTAFDEKRDEARAMLHHVLTQNPEYHEARVFMARTFYWDGDLSNARRELDLVLSKDQQNIEALELMADIELAEKKFEKAIEIADRGLRLRATSEDLLYKKANALVQLGMHHEAATALATLLSINPSHADALRLADVNKLASLKNSIGIQYGIDVFSRSFSPANYLALQAMRITQYGTGVARVNYANRFSLNGIQGEVDLYPKISNGIYGYVNYGYSGSQLFPKHRGGAEIYSKIFRSFEASLGARYLYFDRVNAVTMFTGSLNVYRGNYLVSFRPFLTSLNSSRGFSSIAMVRRYLSDGDNFIGLSGGFGFSPDERRIQTTNGLSPDAVYNLRAQRTSIAWQKSFAKTYIALINAGVIRQELSFSKGDYVWITSFSVLIRKRY